jgi:DNA-binding FadR family transcriptional regulator
MREDHQRMLDAFVARDAETLKAVAEAHHDRLAACIARIGG